MGVNRIENVNENKVDEFYEINRDIASELSSKQRIKLYKLSGCYNSYRWAETINEENFKKVTKNKELMSKYLTARRLLTLRLVA